MSKGGLFSLIGRTILVTGGTRGLGHTLVQRIQEYGASVVVVARSPDGIASVEADLGCRGFSIDISDRAACKSLAERLTTEGLHLDGLILNAAYDPPHFGSLSHLPEEQLDRVIATNIKSSIWLTSFLCPRMADNGGGSIIFILSAAGFRGSNHYAGYAMTKLAGHSLVQSLAAEWAPKNVRVNGIAPSLIRTDMGEHLWGNSERYTKLVENYPLRRIGEPDDVAGIAIMMLSRAGSWLTGQTLIVDGGMAAAAGCYYESE